MSWAKLDDGLTFHPKVIMAGNEITGIFCRCLSYCGKYLTDGKVPADVALAIAGSKKALERTVEVGFLQELPATGDYFISDWADYNPLRDEVEAQREERRERAQRAARKRWDGNGDRAQSNA